MSHTPQSSAEVAKKSRSNLAFALACLPAQRRRDMVSFYAFCRIIDDIADSDDSPVQERRQRLATWRHATLHPSTGITDPILSEVTALPQKYNFPATWLAEVIDGVSSDLTHSRYETITDLLAYCYQVASIVGLVSARIFGAQGTTCDDYAIKLGYAFQLTNIMRDIGQDARETQRIYLPLDELRKFSVTEAAILRGEREPGFTALMDHQWQRAHSYYTQARASLPPTQRGTMIAARMMDGIYSGILQQMKATGYHALTRRERLSSWHKGRILARYVAEGWIRRLLGARQ